MVAVINGSWRRAASLAAVLAACQPRAERERPERSEPVEVAAPAASAAPGGGFCPTAKGTPNACGWSDDGSACTACVTRKCCDEGQACARDCACVACTEAGGAAPCAGKNASFDHALTCLKSRCAAACGITSAAAPAAAPAPQTQGGRCRATRCTQGAAGDALCRRAGCGGGCFFGGCNGF